MEKRIPAEGIPTIATGEDSNRGSTTPINTQPKEKEPLKTDQNSKDLIFGKQNQEEDTLKDNDDVESLKQQLLQQKEELNRQKSEASNFSRIQYETLRDECSRNPAKIADIAKHDPKTADKIVKSIYGEQGIYTVDQLIEFAKNEQKYEKVEDDTILSLKKEIDELKKNTRVEQQKNEKVEEKKFFETLYEKYPSLDKANDSDDANYDKWRKSYIDLNPNLDPYKRMEKAYEIAFGGVDSIKAKEYERGYASIPSGGGRSRKGQKAVSADAESVLKNMGL